MSDIKTELIAAFKDCDDFIIRELSANNNRFTVFALREMVSKDYISKNIILPFLSSGKTDYARTVATLGFKSARTAADAADALLTGSAVLCADCGCYICAADSYFGRSVGEADSDVTVKGGKSGFVEEMEKNICLLRRSVRSTGLKVREYVKGTATNTRVAVVYINGRAESTVVEEICSRIEKASATVIVDSGNIEMLIRDRRYGIFPSFGSTEKVSKAAALLVSGRVLVIVDGSPFLLSAPYLFIESLQSAEDYIRSPFYATLMRCIRFAALLVSLYLPAIFLLFYERYPGTLSPALHELAAKLSEEIPFSMFAELLLMLLVFEMLREVGLRMPRPVGDAVGIVGSIIIGDAATEAGIASTTVILVVAISAVSNFVVPAFMNSTVLLRLVFLFCGHYLGLLGLTAASAVTLIMLFTKKSFGTRYMFPFFPFSARGLTDTLLAIPQLSLGRKELDKKKHSKKHSDR